MKKTIVQFCIVISTVLYSQSDIIHEGNSYYFADQIVVEFNNQKEQLNKSSQNLLNQLGIESINPTLGVSKINDKSNLSNIYTLKYSAPFNPLYIIKQIKKLKEVVWAEPHYLYKLCYVPNDPDTTANKHLNVIKAQTAWDINKGSEDIIIAIVDTGVDWLHEDLASNIWTNSAEIDSNGIDDDGNGYIDDVRGWDFGGENGTADNDPNEDRPDHGTHVAGLAGAVTDNGIGIASIGFNSTLMPVKTSQDNLRDDQNNPLIAYGYEGIVYAADNGADVINLSWGGFNYSHLSQTIIDYAVSKGAVVVAAAGNNGLSDKFYPASYNGVLSVAGTNYVDQKASWSNYGTKIDVSSPGVNIYSTWQDDTYTALDGTSLSSPIVAGLAALVTNQFPNYTPLQIAEQIRVNCDNIDDINSSYVHKLGFGRINAFKALSNNNSYSVRLTNVEIIDAGDKDGILESGEIINFGLTLTNFLSTINNLSISLSTNDNNIEIVKASKNISTISTLEELTIQPGDFQIKINDNASSNIDIDILVSLSANNYEDYDWITISINPTYQNHTTDNLKVTFNSSGSIGFDDYPNNLKGDGFHYKESGNLLFEGALIYGTAQDRIVNTARGSDPNVKDADFTTLSPIVLKAPGLYADKETYTKFNDAFATPTSLNIETEAYTFSYEGENNSNYIFIKYIFNNKSDQTILNFYAGQYWDFDIDETSYENNMANYDDTNQFGYIYVKDGNPNTIHIGLALLSSDNVGFFTMDNGNGTNPTISFDDFTDEEKWTALTGGLNYSSNGPSDISVVISGGPYEILPNDKIEVDFVVAAGDYFSDLQNNIDLAKQKFQDLITQVGNEIQIPDRFTLSQNYPNPFNPSTTIKYSIPSRTVMLNSFQHLKDGEIPKQVRDDNINVSVKVYDILGREVATLVNQKQKPGNYEINFNGSNLPSGVYFYKLITPTFNSVKKMILMK